MICETPSSETVIAPELWICAPSRALTVVPGDERIDHERIDAASGALRALGWSVKEAANVRQVDKSFAGTDAQRAAVLKRRCVLRRPIWFWHCAAAAVRRVFWIGSIGIAWGLRTQSLWDCRISRQSILRFMPSAARRAGRGRLRQPFPFPMRRGLNFS